MPTPLSAYDKLVSCDALENDPAQREVVKALDRLHHDLAEQGLARKGRALGWLFAKRQERAPIRGLYIWGDVGRGKTMLMDLFFERAPINRKRRAHFHEFMAEVHDRIHAHRQKLKRGEVKDGDPIPIVANAIADEARLLCFDEFFVTDIADAMILGRLFEGLWRRGVVVVATSNVVPDGLYKDGLNRALFLPFISFLKEHMQVAQLDARTDFRLEKLSGAPVYHTPLSADADAALDAAFLRLTGSERGHPQELVVKGRTLHVPDACLGVARFSFDDLCVQPLGASDYLKLAHHFHTLVLSGIPVLPARLRNEAKRFTTLIDTLYDNRVKLICSAEAEPHLLHPEGESAFAFERTASRLIEMRSETYLAEPHGARTAQEAA
ncbi:MAG: cell division protein ZapE [Pseudomonadota bacterium]